MESSTCLQINRLNSLNTLVLEDCDIQTFLIDSVHEMSFLFDNRMRFSHTFLQIVSIALPEKQTCLRFHIPLCSSYVIRSWYQQRFQLFTKLLFRECVLDVLEKWDGVPNEDPPIESGCSDF